MVDVHSKDVADVGGMSKFINRPLARNLWAICTKFNKLPNDPLIQSLTTDQWDYILLSLDRDYKDDIRRAKRAGLKVVDDVDISDFDDDSFEEDAKEGKIVHDGDDPTKLASQLSKMTPTYQNDVESKLSGVLGHKNALNKKINDRVKKVQKSANDDDEFPEL